MFGKTYVWQRKKSFWMFTEPDTISLFCLLMYMYFRFILLPDYPTLSLLCMFQSYNDNLFCGWTSYCFLSHLLIAGCDIGVQISVRPFVRSFVRPCVRSFVRPSTFTSKFGFHDIRDSCESETLHSNCP